MLIDAMVNVAAHKPNRTISQDEMSPANMITAEIVNVISRIVGGMITDPQNSRDRFVSARNHPSPSGSPTETIVPPRFSFSDDHCIAESIGEIADLDSAVLEECPFAVTGDVRCIGASFHFADAKHSDVIRNGQLSKISC